MPAQFPTDRRALIRCVRAFVCLLAERLEHGRDIALPNGTSMDQILVGLALHEASWDEAAADLQLVDDEGEAEWFAEIADTLRQVFDDLADPKSGPNLSAN